MDISTLLLVKSEQNRLSVFGDQKMIAEDDAIIKKMTEVIATVDLRLPNERRDFWLTPFISGCLSSSSRSNTDGDGMLSSFMIDGV